MEDFGYALTEGRRRLMRPANEMEQVKVQQDRLTGILRRFVRAEDNVRTDVDLTLIVFERYQRYLAEEHGDPNA